MTAPDFAGSVHRLQVHWAAMLGGVGLLGLVGLAIGARRCTGAWWNVNGELADLRDSELKYRTLADRTSAWEFWTDQDGQWIYCSPACTRISGNDPQEFLATPSLFGRLVFPTDRGLWATHVTTSEQPGSGEGHLEVRIVSSSGETRWLEHTCCAVRGADGRYLGRRGTNRDITERKRAERLLVLQRDLAGAIATSATLGEALRATVTVAIQASGMDSGGVYLAAPTAASTWPATRAFPRTSFGRRSTTGPRPPTPSSSRPG